MLKRRQPIPKYYRLNNRIIAPEVRVIDETGKQIGVLPIAEAMGLAKERGLDLVEIAPTVNPPVCKIVDFGKFLYQEQKKERKQQKQKGGETKNVRLTFAISSHDLEVRGQQALKFLADGNKVNIEMKLRGREWQHQGLAKQKIEKLLEYLRAKQQVKIEQLPKRVPQGFIMSITK